MSKKTDNITRTIIAICILAFLINKWTIRNTYIDILGCTGVLGYTILFVYDSVKKHKMHWTKWAFAILIGICWLSKMYNFFSYLLFDKTYEI